MTRPASSQGPHATLPRLAVRPLPPDVVCVGARFGGALRADGAHSMRYRLTFRFKRLLFGGPQLQVCMLNPSGATPDTSDATITRVLGFARRGGFGEVVVVNRFALRATSPRDVALPLAMGQDIGEEQPWEELLQPGPLLVAWGAPSDARLAQRLYDGTRELVRRWIAIGCDFHALAFTAQGQPRHPLMLRADLPVRPAHYHRGYNEWAFRPASP